MRVSRVLHEGQRMYPPLTMFKSLTLSLVLGDIDRRPSRPTLAIASAIALCDWQA